MGKNRKIGEIMASGEIEKVRIEKELEVDSLGLHTDISGDDAGLVVADGQFSVGQPSGGKESVFGQGDSYPVPNAYHVDMAHWTNGGVVTGAIDISEILQSDSGSSTGLFDGITVGKAILLGSDYMFGGIKLKTISKAVYECGDLSYSYVLDPTTDDFLYMAKMSANSSFPYQQFGGKIANTDSASEQVRFGYQATPPTEWVKTDLTINGTVVNKYWVLIAIDVEITTDPIIEQVKLHTDRFEINADGTTEYFGRSRKTKRFSTHVFENGYKTPSNQDINIVDGSISIGITGNKFNDNADDGLLLIGKIPPGFDTSLPISIDVDFYQDGTATGVVELEISTFIVGDGFLFDGSAVADSTDTKLISMDGIRYKKTTTTFKVSVEKVMIGDEIIISLHRDATSANTDDDTLNDAIVLTGQRVDASYWRETITTT